MIRLKNETDIKYIKKAIKKGEYILKRIARHIKPGITPVIINKEIERLVRVNRATPSFKGYEGFPTTSCISVNENIIHGVPNDIPLKNGDLVKIDLGIDYKGYKSDQARTYIVGERLDHFRLIYATKLALDRAIKIAIPGNTIGDISRTIEKTAEEFELGILKDYCGHGVGFDVHEDPRIPNRVGADKNVELVKGMVLAIEPMFILNGSGDYEILFDGWTVRAGENTAHFEKTIII